MFEAFVLKILISSPGDTGEEVAAVKEGLHGWNGSRAEAAQVILLPRHWRSDAVPRLGAGSGQGVINEQLVDDADIVIALFDARLGQATAEAVSGTAEEIQRAISAGKHVHVWFSNEPIGRDADLEQLAALREFKAALETQGLLGDYDNPADLAYKVRGAIEDDLTQMGLGSPTARRRDDEHAVPRARREGDYLIIANRSQSVTAEQFRFIYEGVWPAGSGRGGNEPVDLMYDGEPIDLLADSEMSWGLVVFWQSPPQLKLTMRWTEGGEPQEVSQTINIVGS
ncbi:hypothetical protein [Mycobacterium colombiense]|uniref:DUF4062 domain-containing protein n=1 Tax=Mycobacterium colombiense TaxID=339268 RepID=A0A853M7I3_9MYCO|nr:hypothetical protein [Mycobacterium colombiense]OBJ24256.1 hypothetical protein A5623_00420 [Mycobacterium colombiense]OBJ64689.1 hypothetical protein A5628_20265 [Mycobacterium colombiense]